MLTAPNLSNDRMLMLVCQLDEHHPVAACTSNDCLLELNNVDSPELSSYFILYARISHAENDIKLLVVTVPAVEVVLGL